MPQGQDYVSNELFHFVGRNEPSVERQSDLLLKILKTGILLSSKCEDPVIEIESGGRLFSGELTRVPALCFCDIRRQSLGIHIKKIWSFWAVFYKTILVRQWRQACFLYPIKEHDVTMPVKPRTEVSQEAESDVQSTPRGGNYEELISDDKVREVVSASIHQWDFLTREIYYFVKLFDEDLAPGHEKNYYMERE